MKLVSACVALVVFASPAARAEDFWWRSEYPALLTKLAASQDRKLTTSFSVRDGKQVRLELSEVASRGTMLVFDAPGEGLVRPNEAGELSRGTGRNMMVITDSDRDGRPDVFSTGPSLKEQSDPLQVSQAEDQAIIATWGVGIGYSINWFLHGVGSASPRR